VSEKEAYAKLREALQVIASVPPNAVTLCPSIAQAILAEVDKATKES